MATINTHIKLSDNSILYAGEAEKGSDSSDTHAYHFYKLYEEQDSESYVGCIGIAISGTEMAVWNANYNYEIGDIDMLIKTVMRLVLPSLQFDITISRMKSTSPYFPVLTIVSGESDLTLNKDGMKFQIGGFNSPREFIKMRLMSGKMTDEAVKDLILLYASLERTTNTQGDASFFSINLPEVIFMDENITRRAYIELEQDGYISARGKTNAGFAPFSYLTEKGRKYISNKNTRNLSVGMELTGKNSSSYISKAIIDRLSNIESNRFDTKKLIVLANELNYNYQNGNAYASAGLLRAITDHVPPIFGFNVFSQVASNYSWGRTDKSFIKKLADYRDVADDALHRQISSFETLIDIDHLPNPRALDVLLTEAAKIHEGT